MKVKIHFKVRFRGCFYERELVDLLRRFKNNLDDSMEMTYNISRHEKSLDSDIAYVDFTMEIPYTLYKQFDHNDQGLELYINEEILPLIRLNCSFTSRSLISSFVEKEKSSAAGPLDWGAEMDGLLKKGSPRYMNSPLANVIIEKPKLFEQKNGNSRKVFIIEEE